MGDLKVFYFTPLRLKKYSQIPCAKLKKYRRFSKMNKYSVSKGPKEP